jgi:nitronate monooxygenase
MRAGDKFLQRLNLEHPIIQAPMAGVSTPAMAAAVSNAGALGSLGIGAAGAAGAADMIDATRKLTARSFNVNVFCHRPARADPAVESAWLARLQPEFQQFGAQPPATLREVYTSFLADEHMLDLLVTAQPAVVSFHFGLPGASQLDRLRAAGIILIASATSLAEAQSIAAAGLDAVIAQGYEAGGHRGTFDPAAADDRIGTLALTRLLVRMLTIPVIAAGGIMDGAGIAAALQLGAVAAQLGTAFIDSPESLADSGYRAALKSEAAHHTEMTAVISGRPARSLRNRFTRWGQNIAAADIPAYPIAYDAGKALHAAAKASSDFSYGAQWAGQGAPLARSLPAADLVRELIAELRAAQAGTNAAGWIGSTNMRHT